MKINRTSSYTSQINTAVALFIQSAQQLQSGTVPAWGRYLWLYQLFFLGKTLFCPWKTAKQDIFASFLKKSLPDEKILTCYNEF